MVNWGTPLIRLSGALRKQACCHAPSPHCPTEMQSSGRPASAQPVMLPSLASGSRRHALPRSSQTARRSLRRAVWRKPSVCCPNLCVWRRAIQNGCCAVANPSARTQATFAFADDPPLHASPQVWKTLRRAVRRALCSSPSSSLELYPSAPTQAVRRVARPSPPLARPTTPHARAASHLREGRGCCQPALLGASHSTQQGTHVPWPRASDPNGAARALRRQTPLRCSTRACSHRVCPTCTCRTRSPTAAAAAHTCLLHPTLCAACAMCICHEKQPRRASAREDRPPFSGWPPFSGGAPRSRAHDSRTECTSCALLSHEACARLPHA